MTTDAITTRLLRQQALNRERIQLQKRVDSLTEAYARLVKPLRERILEIENDLTPDGPERGHDEEA